MDGELFHSNKIKYVTDHISDAGLTIVERRENTEERDQVELNERWSHTEDNQALFRVSL
jgi:hypothetical protein